ncbi:MAG TPA: efflux RND transporter periplasmic adaptor subunit [Polyangia bacterium]
MKAHASRFVVVGLGVLLAASAGLGCARSAAETKAPAQAAPVEAPPLAVTPVAAVAIKVPRVVQLSGNLIGAEQAQVAAGAAGKILATYVERGSVVKKGAVLAKIDSRMLGAQAEEADAQIETLKAQQAQAHLDCDRTKHMFDKGAIAKADFDRAQTQCVTAKWSLAAAEARKTQVAESLRDTQIRAPFSGLVVERGVTAGEYVRPDSRVVTLVAVDPLRVELSVPEADVARIKAGATIEFRAAGGGDGKDAARYKGRIKYIGPAVRQQSRDAIVEALVENADHDLRPGMFVTAKLALGEQTVPAVPKSAVKNDGAQRHLFVVVGDRIEERVVQADDERGGLVPILNGVKAGEMVVATLGPDVRDGARVKQ